MDVKKAARRSATPARMGDDKPVIIFGGSFDPPHRAHVMLLERAVLELAPEKVIIVPAYLSPFKDDHFSPFPHRKKMLEKLLYGSPAGKISEISDFENRRKKRTYAFQIVNAFSRRFPGRKIFFLMGSDSLSTFHKWEKPRKILAKAGLLVGIRKGIKTATPRFPGGKTIFLSGVFPDISSTEIRKELFSGNLSALEPALASYAEKHDLYNYRLAAGVKKLLSGKRFRHTAGTAKLAFELALAHKTDPAAASTAALLHDCAKELPLKKQAELAASAGWPVKKSREILEKAPGIIHQWAGAALAADRFGVKSREILEAVAAHSASYKKTSKLAKLIYVSDFAGYDRKFREANEVRKLAFKNLEKAYRAARLLKRNYLKKEKRWVYE